MPRAECQLQIAHDTIIALLLGEVTVEGISDDDRRYWHAVADTLCWVLEHDHNATLRDNLLQLTGRIRKAGYVMTMPEGRTPPKLNIPKEA